MNSFLSECSFVSFFLSKREFFHTRPLTYWFYFLCRILNFISNN